MDQETIEQYQNPANLLGGEEIPDEQEAGIGWVPTFPGKYINYERRLRPGKDNGGLEVFRQKDGHIGFLLELSSGLVNPANSETSDTDYLLTSYISTTPRDVYFGGEQQFAKDGTPKRQSAVARYLRLAGLDPSTKNYAQIEALMRESLKTPVGVVLGWREEQPKVDGRYVKGYKFKTNSKSYQTSEGKWTPTVTIDGVTYRARPYIVDFCKVPA